MAWNYLELQISPIYTNKQKSCACWCFRMNSKKNAQKILKILCFCWTYYSGFTEKMFKMHKYLDTKTLKLNDWEKSLKNIFNNISLNIKTRLREMAGTFMYLFIFVFEFIRNLSRFRIFNIIIGDLIAYGVLISFRSKYMCIRNS